ncbi:FtsX-like permease family protein [Fructobacillus papyrifericola]|uniref:FtsX-like permease family protein n=1 Tax=Fructobacillus papyrifericola TaxID=2713172 RepID=A0ABS5QTS8_9LACO|nr:FtsX-like permease family protein [Fructobacillus papyrifericola]MBS9336604.1 FtsX-like permease family protein [Fructobacillus papyrifericola]
MFHFKLAFDSLRKNKESYLPFLLASSSAIALNFLMQLLIYAPGVKGLMAAEIVRLLLVLGQVIIGLLSIVIMIYSYSFLNRGKQKEFGLYSILGMQKKNLLKISFIQQFLSFCISLIIGLISGFVFAKVMIMLLIKLIDGSSFKMTLSIPALLFTVLLFALIFIILTIVDTIAVYRSNTLDLMKSEKKVEGQPKNRWILFLLGFIALTIGYGLSLTVPTPLKAVKQFFFAALLIIVATYLLFIAASTLILKTLQKNQSYYYQSKHFITVSNMLFRMKQNAVGLASITLLSTMTLVVSLTTATMFFGRSNLMNDLFPTDTIVRTTGNNLSLAEIKQLAKKDSVSIKKAYEVTTSNNETLQLNKSGKLSKPNTSESSQLRNVAFMSQENYQKLTGKKIRLSDQQIALFQGAGKNTADSNLFKTHSLEMDGQNYQITKTLDSLSGYPKGSNQLYPQLVIITADSAYTKLVNQFVDVSDLSSAFSTHGLSLGFAQKESQQFYLDITAKGARKKAFYENIKQKSQNPFFDLEDKEDNQKIANALYGGFFFIGILFSLSFILATGLMIYYKQISEGKADQSQFEILQKVGMSEDEIKKTIRSQIVWLFGLPIVVSIVHLGFAFPMIQKLLLAFAVPMTSAVYWIMAVTITLMVIIYFLIYKLTSRTYFKQVTAFRD